MLATRSAIRIRLESYSPFGELISKSEAGKKTDANGLIPGEPTIGADGDRDGLGSST